MIRALLDTNELVSALIQPAGKPARILAFAGFQFEWLTSEYILSETAQVLTRRHIQRKYRTLTTRERREAYLSLIREAAIIITTTTTISRCAPIRKTTRCWHAPLTGKQAIW